jgi:hypothetical protein
MPQIYDLGFMRVLVRPDYPSLRRTIEKPECMVALDRFLETECKRSSIQMIYESTPPFRFKYAGRKK